MSENAKSNKQTHTMASKRPFCIEDEWVTDDEEPVQHAKPSRPPSMHSLNKPHPLIRGTSYSHLAPLAPVAVTTSPTSSSPTSTHSEHPPDRRLSFSSVERVRVQSAMSSLAQLPAVTRPPSPQTVVFFPPNNPHNNLENIHPLLPAPYLHNHLTTLARRTPIRESYDRVIKAKYGRNV